MSARTRAVCPSEASGRRGMPPLGRPRFQAVVPDPRHQDRPIEDISALAEPGEPSFATGWTVPDKALENAGERFDIGGAFAIDRHDAGLEAHAAPLNLLHIDTRYCAMSSLAAALLIIQDPAFRQGRLATEEEVAS